MTANYIPITSITVNTVVINATSSDWKFNITGPDGYSVSFNSTAEGESPTWFSGYGFTVGNYTVTETTKFGYYTNIDIQGDLDSGSVFSYSNVTVDLDIGEDVTINFTNTILPAFTVPLDSAPPADLDYNIPALTPTLVQSAWSTDINADGRIDLVLDKPTAVMLNFTGVTVGSSVSVSIDLGGITSGPIVKTNAELASNSIISFYPIIPNILGAITLTGTYSVDGGTAVALPSVDVTVKETTGPPIADSYLFSQFHTISQTEGFNIYGFSDPQVDELIDQARSTTSQNIRLQAYQEAQERIVEQIPAIFLYVPDVYDILRYNVAGWEYSPTEFIYAYDLYRR